MSDPVYGALPLGAVWQPPILRASGVTKRWGGSGGLGPTTLAVAPGELVAVLGRPGSGKSTLLGLLAGWFLPDEGEIERSGDWAIDGGWATWRHTTVVPAADLFVPELTVAEHVGAVLRALGVARSQQAPFVLHVLDRLRLVPVAGRLPREISSSEAQRLAVARALAGSVAGAVPTMVVADEPTRRQDRTHADVVISALTEVAAAGAAVVVATDDDPLAEVARVVVLG
jgi:ABC-type multidrug transport system ATPase subunit